MAAGSPDLSEISEPSRLAHADEGITADELQLAARNHGLPLEALRYDVTPTGLHYLLTHFDIPHLDAAAFRLAVDGLVDQPVSLSLADLARRPQASYVVTLECAGNGRALLDPRPISQPWLVEAVGTSRWTGTSLATLLRECGIHGDAVEVVFTGADHGVERGVEQDYQWSLPLEEALREEVLLVHEMNGAPLLPQHGYPLRLVVPGWYGMAQVKWLTRVEVVGDRFDGFQLRTYRRRQQADEPGSPVTRIEPRALIAPPGFPDYMSRRRFVRSGRTILEGRAWSGWGAVRGVDVSVDGGQDWHAAAVEPADHPWGWSRWTWSWDARPGRHLLCAQAVDDVGHEQPPSAPWTRGGFANNVVQVIDVLVVD